MYERHYFSDLTSGKYDSTHPDISWPVGYRKKSQLGSTDKKMHDHKVDADDIYSSYAISLASDQRLSPRPRGCTAILLLGQVPDFGKQLWPVQKAGH